MKKTIVLLMITFIGTTLWGAAPNVIPSLKDWTDGSGLFTLTINSRIVVNSSYWEELQGDANTFKDDLYEITGKKLTVVNGGAPESGDFYLLLGSANPSIGDEGYTMNISGYVEIAAKASTGVFYGTQTVLQILEQDSSHVNIPHGACVDYPDWPMRALMVDPARRFLSVDFMNKWIRRLAWYKMNYFHIHFTDSEGFRLESTTYPGLASKDHYTHAQIEAFEALAAKYHVNIIPEIDMPGHAAAIIAYNPDLAFSTGGLTKVLNVTSSDTRDWLHALLDEYLTLFDGSKYFHIGTDEFPVPYHNWWPKDILTGCPELVAYQKLKGYSEPMDCFVEFMNWANNIIKSHGKTMRMWDWWEWAPHGIDPDKDIGIDLWESPEDPVYYTPTWYADRGYQLLNCSEGWLYWTPAFKGKRLKVPTFITEGYTSNTAVDYHEGIIPASNCRGAKLQLWGNDNYDGLTEDQINSKLVGYTGALGEMLWGGPRSGSLDIFYNRQHAIGEAPAFSGGAKPGHLAH